VLEDMLKGICGEIQMVKEQGGKENERKKY
jgi:hypothetical protein